MNLKKSLIVLTMSISTILSAQNNAVNDDFNFLLEHFSDLKILRYHVPGFEELPLQKKIQLYYLSQAALCGRDIIYDQNCKYNLTIRRTLETILETYTGDKATPDYKEFMIYLKRVWFSNGIHHHYSMEKFFPGISREAFVTMLDKSNFSRMPVLKGETKDAFAKRITQYIYDPDFMPMRASQDASKDLVLGSACNFYEGVNQKEVEDFYKAMKKEGDPAPVSYGLNSKVVKENGTLVEKVWSVNGMYGSAISQITGWLEKAAAVAENESQRAVIEKLISYYKTGNLKTFDEYNILWVQDMKSEVDFINGFIEVYGDPLGTKATWESVVNYKNIEATKRTGIISANAQWFEDHSPVDPRFRKKEVKGVSAKVITVVQLGGDCYPATPIGINLPNADWIRKEHGSKSVTIENITYAYDKASLKTGFLDEFASGQDEIELVRKYGASMSNLHVDLHECLGHGSGQLLPGVSTDAMKNYHSPLEETRADLFALYYMMDPRMLELGLIPDMEAPKAEYVSYIRNGLMTQLVRIELGKDVMEAHMRNRQLIAKWCYEHGKKDNVIEFFKNNGKTYRRINDYQKLRELFGKLLMEVQRIKSEGDYEACKNLVEGYGVKIDYELHKEILERYKKLNLAPYSGFVNPVLTPVEKDGRITDIKIEYVDDYSAQMLWYSKKYSFLPDMN